MINEEINEQFVFSAPVIDFVTVAAESCLLLENADEYGRQEFVGKGLKMLSLLYLKASMLEIPDRIFDEDTERFVTEAEYNELRELIAGLLGEYDSFLETFHPDMSLSDTPVAAFISENLADIYQELKDFATNYQLANAEIMQDALATCLEAFAEHWGQKLLNALRALHAYRYSDNYNQIEEETEEVESGMQKVNRSKFLNYLRDEDEEEALNGMF
jgi:hypothetical protein